MPGRGILRRGIARGWGQWIFVFIHGYYTTITRTETLQFFATMHFVDWIKLHIVLELWISAWITAAYVTMTATWTRRPSWFGNDVQWWWIRYLALLYTCIWRKRGLKYCRKLTICDATTTSFETVKLVFKGRGFQHWLLALFTYIVRKRPDPRSHGFDSGAPAHVSTLSLLIEMHGERRITCLRYAA